MIEDQGLWLCREVEKRECFSQKYQNLFAPCETGRESFGDWAEVYSGVQLLNDKHLTAPFSLEEIKRDVFQLGGDKAPGSDDFSQRFYQKFWEVIQADIFRIFEDLFNGKPILGQLTIPSLPCCLRLRGLKQQVTSDPLIC